MRDEIVEVEISEAGSAIVITKQPEDVHGGDRTGEVVPHINTIHLGGRAVSIGTLTLELLNGRIGIVQSIDRCAVGERAPSGIGDGNGGCDGARSKPVPLLSIQKGTPFCRDAIYRYSNSNEL